MKTYEHWLQVPGTPHPQSMASLILLTRQYYTLTKPLRNYRKWLLYRKHLLKKIREEHGPLTCHYCGKPNLKINTRSKNQIATLDHVIPKSKGGADYDCRNLVVACYQCNQKKKDHLLP